MGTKERLLLYLQRERLSQAKFEKVCGLSNGYVNNIKVSVSPKKLQSISLQFPDLNMGWLLTGEGTMLKSEQAGDVSITRGGVPYFDVDFVSGFDNLPNISQSPFSIDFQPFNSSDVWINVLGRSMEPMINHGDIIAIKRISDWRSFIPFGELYALVTDEFRTVRIITQADNEAYLKLVPLNKNEIYCEQQIEKRKIRNMYAVLGVVKRFM